MDKEICKSGGEPTTWLEKLPKDIFFHILSKLPIISLLECKFVCILWKASVKNPNLVDMHLSQAFQNNLCVILHSEWPKFKLQLVHIGEVDISMDKAKLLNIPFQDLFPDFNVVGSCNGLLCLSHFVLDDPLYIYNPFGKEYKKLPPKGKEHSHEDIFRLVYGFGFHSTTKEYKVIKIVYSRGNSYFTEDMNRKHGIYVYTLGTAEWRCIGQTHYHLIGPSSEALVNGKLHWSYVNGEGRCQDIISFDLATEEFPEIPGPMFVELNKPDFHLVALNGCLSAVVSHRDGTNEIWVMKHYNVKESWTRDFIIGNYVPKIDLKPIYTEPCRANLNGSTKRKFRVLCSLSNGEILLLYGNRTFVYFNPIVGEFKKLKFHGLPIEFSATVHVGSLVSVDEAFNMPRGDNNNS